MIDWEKWKNDMLHKTEDGWWLDDQRRRKMLVGDAVIVQATVEPQERRVRDGVLATSEIFGRTVPDIGNPAIEWPGTEGAVKALIRTPYKLPAVRIYVGGSTREIAAIKEGQYAEYPEPTCWRYRKQVSVGLVADHMIRYRQPDAVLPDDLSLLDATIPFCGSLWEPVIGGDRYIIDGPTGQGRTFQSYRMAQLQEERWPSFEQLCEHFGVSGDLEIRFDSAEVAGKTCSYMKIHVKKSRLALDI